MTFIFFIFFTFSFSLLVGTCGPLTDHELLFLSYMQSSGYKPAPLDLNHVKLTPNQNTLVERLAENGHNVWARDRVRQGWTYSIMQVLFSLEERSRSRSWKDENVGIFFSVGHNEQEKPPPGSLQPAG